MIYIYNYAKIALLPPFLRISPLFTNFPRFLRNLGENGKFGGVLYSYGGSPKIWGNSPTFFSPKFFGGIPPFSFPTASGEYNERTLIPWFEYLLIILSFFTWTMDISSPQMCFPFPFTFHIQSSSTQSLLNCRVIFWKINIILYWLSSFIEQRIPSEFLNTLLLFSHLYYKPYSRFYPKEYK